MIIQDQNITKGKNNFDFIRLLAALFVFWEHAFAIFTGQPMHFDLSRELFSISVAALGVCIFFSLSGFLVTQSLTKAPGILTYLLSRVFRILPALIVVTLLSILILGLFFSTHSFGSYLADHQTWLYLKNCLVYRTYYYLPGVFETNPVGASVNGSLWTIPYEFTCYLVLPVLMLLPFIKNKWVTLFIFITCWILFVFFESEIYRVTIPFVTISLKSFTIPFLYFFSGVCYYRLRNRVRINLYGIIACAVILLLIRFQIIPRITFVFVLPYLVLWLAFHSKINLRSFGKWGDFSYGFYLYAFPVQQAVCSLFYKQYNFYCLVILAFIITGIFAVFSWYFVEKPALILKKSFNKKFES